MSLLKELAKRVGIDTRDTVGTHVSKEELIQNPEALQEAQKALEEKHGSIDWTGEKDGKYGVTAFKKITGVSLGVVIIILGVGLIILSFFSYSFGAGTAGIFFELFYLGVILALMLFICSGVCIALNIFNKITFIALAIGLIPVMLYISVFLILIMKSSP